MITVGTVQSQIQIPKPASAMDWLRRGESQLICNSKLKEEAALFFPFG